METSQEAKRDVYSIITDRIIDQLEKGTVPWKKPWTDAGLPQNLITKRPYRGINVWLLSMLGYERNYFLTWKQLKEIGGAVKKGERLLPVVFWKWNEIKDDESEETKTVSFIRYYLVLNIDQCEGIPEHFLPSSPERVVDPIAECEKVIERMPDKPLVKHKEHKAFYNPLHDFVNMPGMNTFGSSESFYATYFHELVHSTGHPSRLARKELMQMSEFGSESYSIEELIAEMGACYLLSHCGLGITTFENSAAYIQGWLEKLKDNRQFVIYAAAKAQRAVDFILNLQQVKDTLPEPQGMSRDEEDSPTPF